MKNLIIAREREKAELERLMNEPTAQMLAVYGRRRTGKTFPYWHDNQNSPRVNSWRGRAFEDVCFVHQQQVKRAVGIDGVQAEVYPWHATGDAASPGAQIDMLIDRADRVMNLCEMKFTQSDYVISKDYDERLRNKIAALQEMTRSKRNVQVVLVTTYGLKQNMYSGRVQRVVTLEDLFG